MRCYILQKLYDDETIQSLLDISWWDWSAEKITKNLETIVGE